jgi:hypothetical protein
MEVSKEQHEQMIKQIHQLKTSLKNAVKILKDYNGSHALDQWDEDMMPSREWVAARNEFLKSLSKKKP